MRFEAFLAFRYLRARGRHAFINLITLLSMAGVALGVCALIVVLSVMGGFQDEITRKILGMSSHLTIYQAGGAITHPDRVLKLARQQPGVKAAAPYVYGQVMLVSSGGATGALLSGLDVPLAKQVKNLESSLVQGKLSDLDRPTPRGLWGIILGSRLANKLGLHLGMVVNVINPLGEETPVGRAPKSEPFQVVGIFESGLYFYDAGSCYVGLAAAQEFLGLGRGVNGVEVALKDIYQAPLIGRQLASKLGPLFFAQDWMSANHSLFAALKLEKLAMFIILILIVLVASFGIVSSLIMMVMTKTREIGVLKAMGATRASLRRIFVLQGMVTGLVGTVLGVISGLVLCWLLTRYHFIELPKDVYTVDTLPVQVEPLMVLLVAASAVAISLLATIYPSRVAGSLDPVQALRYE
ncbi:MAG: lipoprotein-releasing ABC transporter permease subunit [Thermodesulfobacteriota bacterium]